MTAVGPAVPVYSLSSVPVSPRIAQSHSQDVSCELREGDRGSAVHSHLEKPEAT